MKKNKEPQKLKTNSKATELSAKKTSFSLWIFILGVFCSTVAFNTVVLDRSLLPRFFALSVFCGILTLSLVVWGRKRFSIPNHYLLWIYVAYWGLSVASAFWGMNKGEAIFDASRITLGFMIFVFGFYIIWEYTEQALLWLGRISLLLSVVSFVIGMNQIVKMIDTNAYFVYNITAIYANKNLYASFLFINTLFCLITIIRDRSFLKIIAWICIIFNLIFIYLIAARATFVGVTLAVSLVPVLYLARKIKYSIGNVGFYTLYASVIVAALAFFLFVFPPLLAHKVQGFQQDFNKAETLNLGSTVDRIVAWNKTYSMIKDYPVLGVGAGNWQILISNYGLTPQWEAFNMAFQRPHNDFLWILSEKGIIGLTIFLALVVGIILGASRLIKRFTVTREYMTLILLISFATGYYLLSFFDFPMERFEHTIWINITLAALLVYILKAKPEAEIKKLNVHPAIGVAFLGACVFFLYVSYKRYQGETSMQGVYQYKSEQKYADVIREADDAFSYFYSIDPFAVPILWFKGNMYANQSDFKTALPILKEAYKYNPYNRHLLNDIGSSYVMTGKNDTARFYYEEAARISPNFDDPRLNLIVIYIKERNREKAQYWEKTITRESDRRKLYKSIIDTLGLKK